MQLDSYLEQLGLSERESRVYLASLELNASYVVPIATRVSMPRTTVVYILERLSEKNLIEIVYRGSRKLYTPVAPQKMLTQLKEHRLRLDEQIAGFEQGLPELQQRYATRVFEPQVRMFRGVAEIRRIYEELLLAPIDAYYYVGDTVEIEALLGARFLEGFIRRRVERKIWSHAVRAESGEVDNPLYKPSKSLLRSVRLAPAGFSAPSHVLIFGDNVASITTTRERIGVVITSRDLAQTMTSWFHQLWKTSRASRKEVRKS